MSTTHTKRTKPGTPRLRINRGGPNFFLNPYIDAAFTRCPKCNGRTKVRKIPLVAHVEGAGPLAWSESCRFCPPCNLVITHQQDVEEAIRVYYGPGYADLTSEDYLVLGVLTRQQWQKCIKEDSRGEELISQTAMFENVYEFVPADPFIDEQEVVDLRPARPSAGSTPKARAQKGPSPGKRGAKAATAAKSTDIYELRITLRNSDPPIWRRVAVPGDLTLDRLHDVIQAAMGWEDEHLHQFFDKNKTCYASDYVLEGDFSEGFNEEQVELSQVLDRRGAKLLYEYDFGDSWEHEVKVEKIRPAEPGADIPICLAGEQACPPEDCGGLWGYYNLLDTLSDPNHDEHEVMLEWTGGKIDPEAFDLEAVNKRLRSLGR